MPVFVEPPARTSTVFREYREYPRNIRCPGISGSGPLGGNRTAVTICPLTGYGYGKSFARFTGLLQWNELPDSVLTSQTKNHRISTVNKSMSIGGLVNNQTQGRINVIGDRIRQARLAASLTQDEVVSWLAETGHAITKAALSKYENKKSEPRQTLLLALARVLGVKPAYFLAEPDLKIEWLAFRKQSRLLKTTQEQIKARVSNVLEGQIWLQETLFPDAKPFFPRRVRVTGPEGAEEAAMKLRKKWNLDDVPIDSVIKTVEDKWGFVVGVSVPGVKFDSLSVRVGGWPLIVVNESASVDRCRFNAAHELGHLQMICGEMTEREEEKLAYRFAAALLVPEAVAREELGSQRRHLSLGELGVLKRKYGLSIQAWARRAKDLRIISENEYKTLCIEISRRGWRGREPEPVEFDFMGYEQPTRLKQMTLRALSEGIISQEQAERICKGSTEGVSTVVEKLEGVRRSPRELLRLPREERARILAAAAAQAEKEYRTNADLTDFEAFEEGDLYVE